MHDAAEPLRDRVVHVWDDCSRNALLVRQICSLRASQLHREALHDLLSREAACLELPGSLTQQAGKPIFHTARRVGDAGHVDANERAERVMEIDIGAVHSGDWLVGLGYGRRSKPSAGVRNGSPGFCVGRG